MKIAEGRDVHLSICDIETYYQLFDAGFYDPDTGVWTEFEISQWKNDLYSFVKFYTSKSYDYCVTFNGINFDQQVMEYIVDEHQNWHELSNLEIVKKISDFASQVIENQNYRLSPRYTEEQFSIKPIDIFKIHHFDNEARRTSLKFCEFMLNMDVEEMPVPFTKIGLTQDDILEVKRYRRHDVLATYKLLLLTIGNVDLPELKDYKGKNKIQDRFDVMETTGLQCLNWSDVKIGEEWNKLDYMQAENIKNEWDIVPKKVTQPFGKPFRTYFPDTVEFKTGPIQDFVRKLGAQPIKRNKKGGRKQEYRIKLGKTEYTIAKGGIHSNEKQRMLIPPEGWHLTDADVGLKIELWLN
jgi:hypothetical protein